jgi:acyl-coenzyme A thioesterase PaaI-like protein
MYKIDLNLDLLKIIPFANYVGVKKRSQKLLQLTPHKDVENHIGTVHAAAQFTLAETQSGLYLLSLFPEYADNVVPLLRSSNIKYKYPATTELVAVASVTEENKNKFENEFEKRGRAMLMLKVKIKDAQENVTMIGDFGWYVQKKELVMKKA